MEYQNIIVEKGRVSKLILNRPDKRNAMNKSMMIEIEAALYELGQDPQVAVIIMSGAGKGFCAGGDLDGMVAPENILDSLDMKSYIMGILTVLGKVEKVVISQIHGFALAGGFGMAMAADLTVVTDNCKLGMPEIKRGLGPMNIMKPLSCMMPRKALLEMMFTGETISPQQALEWGLVNRMVAPESLEAETMRLAESIACHSAAALRLCKKAFYNMQSMEYFTSFQYLTDILTISGVTEDAKEGVAAFFENREPCWTDR